MANSNEGKQYSSRGDHHEGFSDKNQSVKYKNSDMMLNFGSKLETFATDQTPTPIRLIQKCEEMGVFQDFQSVNPFEETFRKAAENIRSGTMSLEVSSLSVSNNNDDSLHTPHVIFPSVGEASKIKRPVSPRDDLSITVIPPDPDHLCIPLDSNDTSKAVVQQEADTSEQTQLPNISTSADESPSKTIQFLLRMPNGKMVKLSSLPVEQMDTADSAHKDIPTIKIDSSFLETANEGGGKIVTSLNSAVISGFKEVDCATPESSRGHVVDSDDENVVERSQSITESKVNESSVKSFNNNFADNSPNISLAKLKLKQALMKNSCPAANSSSSSNIISSSRASNHTAANSASQFGFVSVRRPSSTSDEGGTTHEDIGRDLSSVEEKRRRNRAAAMRCREKRKTWVKELERRANDMLRTNGQLQYEVSLLRDEVAQLKTLLLAHKDCPVTQALVQGNATLPTGSNLPTLNPPSQNLKRPNKGHRTSTVVIQSPSVANSVKPMLLLNDPPMKRKRRNSAINSADNAQSSSATVSASPAPSSSSSTVHTLVLASKSQTVLNSSFVNVIPSVLVANPTSTCDSVRGPSQVIYSQILPCLPALAPNPSLVGQRQPYILPKITSNTVCSPEKRLVLKPAKSDGKLRSNNLLSTNVIKVNPNVVERDNGDSDIEILDVKPARS